MVQAVPTTPSQRTLKIWQVLVLAASMALPVSAQSLLDLYQSASQYDATYRAALSNYEASVASAAVARAPLWPQVGLQANVQRSHSSLGNPNQSSNSSNKYLGLQASYSVYDPAKRASAEQGELAARIAKLQWQMAEQELMLRVAQSYFDVLAAQDHLGLIQTQQRAVAEQMESAKRNFEVGTSTITDKREAQARADLVAAEQSAAEFDLQSKSAALAQLVGTHSVAPYALNEPFLAPVLSPHDMPAWLDNSLSHPQLQAASLQKEIASLETRKAKAGHVPTLDFNLGYAIKRGFAPDHLQLTTGANSNMRSREATAAIILNVPLFTGYATQNAIREKQSLERKALSDASAAERTQMQAVRTAFYAVQSSAAQVKALETALQSSMVALDANRLAYEAGVRINIDVLNAQSQLYQTARDLARARYGLLLAHLQLKQAAGVLQADDLRSLSTLFSATGNTPLSLVKQGLPSPEIAIAIAESHKAFKLTREISKNEKRRKPRQLDRALSVQSNAPLALQISYAMADASDKTRP